MKHRSVAKCMLCGCRLHRNGIYGRPTPEGRSHATEHHFVAERFYGRSKNRRGTQRDPLFGRCPWGVEGEKTEFCYECHEEVIHNPVLLPGDFSLFAELVRRRGLSETRKPNSRRRVAGRVKLFHEIISEGLAVLSRKA
jgi:hypothetical protein